MFIKSVRELLQYIADRAVGKNVPEIESPLGNRLQRVYNMADNFLADFPEIKEDKFILTAVRKSTGVRVIRGTDRESGCSYWSPEGSIIPMFADFFGSFEAATTEMKKMLEEPSQADGFPNRDIHIASDCSFKHMQEEMHFEVMQVILAPVGEKTIVHVSLPPKDKK